MVPYSPYLLWKYQCHINVESVFSLRSIKYIYKYVYKGLDRATLEITAEHDEVSLYLDARYITASEGCWHLFGFNMHAQKPAVMQLQVHLEMEQVVYYDPKHQPQVAQVLEHQKDTVLTAFFKANQLYPDLARGLLYQEFPQKFTWKSKTKEWTPQKKDFAIGRMYYVPPSAGDKFYL